MSGVVNQSIFKYMVGLMVLSGPVLLGQAKPGIYITMNLELDLCHHKIKLINSENLYCLSEEPILDLNAFERVEEIIYDSIYELRKFRIVLTQKGADYLNTIGTKLPDHSIALVVNNMLVSVIDLNGATDTRSIIIWDYADNQAMEWVHQTLIDRITANHKKS